MPTAAGPAVDTARVQFGARLCQQRAGGAHLLDRRHERKQDPQRPVRGRAQQRPQLRLEDRRVRQAEPDAAQPGVSRAARLGKPARVERGIHQRPRQLTLVDVERADRDRPGRHALGHLAVLVILLVLPCHVRRTADQQELRSIQADTFGA